jgi:type IV pilus assembly protein PilA
MARNSERGFTLIEILVVLLIVTILAAIALPLFLNQRAKGQDANAKAVAATAVKAIEVYGTEHDGFAAADVPALVKIEPTLSSADGLTVTSTDDTFLVSVDSPSGDGPFTVERTPGVTTRSCEHPGQGGCPDSGHW